jgi:hypothetical protein
VNVFEAIDRQQRLEGSAGFFRRVEKRIAFSTLVSVIWLTSAAAQGIDIDRIQRCVDLQIRYLHSREYNGFNTNCTRGSTVDMGCINRSVEEFQMEFDENIADLRQNEEWQRNDCVLAAPQPSKSYDDLVEEVDRLNDRVRELERQ